MSKIILLNPGPVNLSPRVREALLRPDLCHREKEFSQLQDSIRERILSIYELPKESWASILLTGSGTSALEAMLTSMIPRDQKVLIIENGVYGERMSKICEIHNIDCDRIEHAWDQPVDLDKLEQRLGTGYAFVAVVHHETTTGRLNDLAAIGELCKSQDVCLLVDGVSSFAAEELNFHDWNIAACAATANKCLHGIPGASFVIVNRQVLKQAQNPARTLYLDLETYLVQQDKGATPFTQSVQSFYALDEALDEHDDEGGWKGRRQTYRDRMRIMLDGLHGSGIKSLLPDNASSCVLHTFLLPEGIDYPTLHDELKSKGYIIYAGQGYLLAAIFRISLMGDISDQEIHQFLSDFQEIIQ